MPYVVGKAERYEGEEGNPFATGRDQGITFGIDGKIGITNDVTLDFTVNPDFGQVEADPSQLNLSAFQLFFEERRPFFIEGNNILNFQVTQFRNDNLFYSRRIGDRPSRYPDMGSDAYEKIPDNTRVLGAAKITVTADDDPQDRADPVAVSFYVTVYQDTSSGPSPGPGLNTVRESPARDERWDIYPRVTTERPEGRR